MNKTCANTPSKYLSMKFLRKLKNNRYVSESSKGFKEYSRFEVDMLYNEKCEKQASSCSLEREISSLDRKIEDFISMQAFLNSIYNNNDLKTFTFIKESHELWTKQLTRMED